MSTATAYAGGVWAVLRRDFLIFASYRTRLVSQLLTMMVSLSLFYYISRLVQVSTFDSPDAYYGFVVIGLIVMNVLTATLTTNAGALTVELMGGTFERMVVSPFGAVATVCSMMIFPFAYAIAMGVAQLVFAALAFGLPLHTSTLVLGLPVALLGALAFAPFGMLIASLVLVFKQAGGVANIMLAGLTLIAGLYFPIALLPDWVQWTSNVQPFTPAVDLLRHVLTGHELAGGSAWAAAGRLVAFVVLLMPFAFWVLSKAVKVGRRRGTITEY